MRTYRQSWRAHVLRYGACSMLSAVLGLWAWHVEAAPAQPGAAAPQVTPEDPLYKRKYPKDDARSAVPNVVRERPKPFKKGHPITFLGGQLPTFPWSPRIHPPKKIKATLSPGAAAAVTSCETASLANAKFETAAGTAAAQWCDDYGKGYTRVAVTPAKYNYVARAIVGTGVPADQLNAGPYQIVDLNQTAPKNVFIGGMLKGSNVQPNPDGAGAIIDVGFTVDCSAYPEFCTYNGIDPADATLWCSTLPSSGTFDWRWVGLDSHSCGIGYVDSASHWVDVPIKSAQVFPILYLATGTAYFDLIQLIQFSPGPGAVTFMFDDGYASTKSIAKPILDKYGFPGSTAAITSAVGTQDYMSAQNLKDLQAARWDIASHSVAHPSMTGLSTSAARAELQNSKSYLTSLGLTIDAFVWPYGDYNQTLISLAQAGIPTSPLYRSTRGTYFDDNAYGTFPYGTNVLEMCNFTRIEDVQSWIDNLKDTPSCRQNCIGRWGIILGHDIADNPDTYQIAPAFMDQVAQLVATSGLQVINYRTGYQRFANITAP